MTLNQIGIDSQHAGALADKLNQLLADYQLFYMNARALHWNIRGERFFELHAKFEELYTDLLLKVDEVAERVLTLGKTPLHTYSDYSKRTRLKEVRNVTEAEPAVQVVLDDFQALLTLEREIFAEASEAADEGTASLMSDYIKEQEKLVWMYSAYLAKA